MFDYVIHIIKYLVHIFIIGKIQKIIIAKYLLPNRKDRLKQFVYITVIFIIVLNLYRYFYEYKYLDNVYTAFNLKRNSSLIDIKKSYKKFLRESHPDVSNFDSTLFIKYKDNFQSLLSIKKKWFYDRFKYFLKSDREVNDRDFMSIISNIIMIFILNLSQFFLLFFVSFQFSKIINRKKRILFFLFINIFMISLIFDDIYLIKMFNIFFYKWTVFDFLSFTNFFFPIAICFFELYYYCVSKDILIEENIDFDLITLNLKNCEKLKNYNSYAKIYENKKVAEHNNTLKFKIRYYFRKISNYLFIATLVLSSLKGK